VALYWSVVFAIVAVAAAVVGFGDGSAPTAPAAQVISLACMALVLLIAFGRLYARWIERRRERHRRQLRATPRHSYR
jgi:uncharacterized membrane protein YtjA (UPF0391 family)